MPGMSPNRIGNVRARTVLKLRRFRITTQEFIASSTRTRAGARTRLEKNSSAIGTVSDEKPYPRAPLTNAAAAATKKKKILRRSTGTTLIRSPPLQILHYLNYPFKFV